VLGDDGSFLFTLLDHTVCCRHVSVATVLGDGEPGVLFLRQLQPRLLRADAVHGVY
jgi:hypothetical protein